MSKLQIEALLSIMKKLESSDGTNTDHAKLSDGTNAVGNYGIKPITAQDMLKRTPANVNDKNIHEVQRLLEDSPEMQQQVANILAAKVLNKNKGQLDPSAAGWQNGQNRSIEYNKEYLKDNGLYQDRVDQAKRELNIMPTLYNKIKEPR